MYKFGLFQISVSLWEWDEIFSQWKKLHPARQDDCSLWNCYLTCISQSSLRTWRDQALKPQYEDTYDVFEGVQSHLVLGNKNSRTWWAFTLLPSFIMGVKSELMQWTTMFICLLEFFFIVLSAKCKKNNNSCFNQNFVSFENKYSMD